MSNEVDAADSTVLRPAPQTPAPSGSARRLKGRMGVIELVFTVLAWSAPVMVVSASTPFIISFGGTGAPLAYVIAMAVLLIFSVGYTTMTRYVDNPGAFYAYITAGLGRAPGLGASFLAIVGYLFMAVATYMFIGVSLNTLLETIGAPTLPWFVYTFAVLAVTGVLGYFRIDLSAKVLSVVMVCEIVIVGIFDGAVVGRGGGPEGVPVTSFTWSALMSGSVGVAVLFSALSFGGFEATAVFREETKDPHRTVPRATYLAVGAIGVFYIAATWLLIAAYGPSQATAAAAADPTGMFSAAVETFVGVWARDVVTVLVVTSAFAALLSVQNIVSRYCYSLAVDRVLPARLAKVHPRHGSPNVSSVTVSVVLFAALLAFSGIGSPELWYAQLAGTGGFAIMVLMTLTSLAVIVFFRRRRDIRDSTRWHTFIAPLLSAAGMGMVLYLAITNFTTMTGGSTTQAVVEQVVVWGVLAAGAVLALVYRTKRPGVYARIGRQKA
ncbi:APC family permease [Amycolatopsis thermalba]|uniref:APC family permease n=1 Tax=Amycolatopsis thermalba TaxID=944492 RepID=A0ABY4P0Y0_9PSEU|nr:MULTISPECIES: APC family permease [Amycolatopsis]UQS25999.1 APC family permease [Amycolatopsis thermalba]